MPSNEITVIIGGTRTIIRAVSPAGALAAGVKECMNQCPSFAYCSAPLCPLDPRSLHVGLWYPDEPVCTRTGAEDWIQRQRRIARLGLDPAENVFSFAMLERNFRLTKKIKGINPESPNREQAVAMWMKKHPPLKAVSEEQIAIARERIQKVNEQRKAVNL